MKTRTPFMALGSTAVMSLGLVAALGRMPQEQARPTGQESNVFVKKVEARDFKLTYGWRDFRGKNFRLSFAIAKKDLEEAEREFGYTQDDLDRHLMNRAVELNEKMIADLKDFVRKLIDGSGYEQYILVVEKDALSFDLKLSVPHDLQDKVKPAYESIKSRMNDEYKASVKKIENELVEEEKAFVKSRGIIFSPEGLRVDYRRSVQNNRARVRHVLEAMRRIDGKLNLRQFLGLSLSFIQDLANGVPPAVEGDKLILGFWVPPKVLANNFGDCDSKGVTFAALWMNFKKYPLILIRVPDHMFVGLAIPSLESEGVVINGLRYTLCEVSATDKIPPGLVSYYSRTWLESGRYQYDLITR